MTKLTNSVVINAPESAEYWEYHKRRYCRVREGKIQIWRNGSAEWTDSDELDFCFRDIGRKLSILGDVNIATGIQRFYKLEDLRNGSY